MGDPKTVLIKHARAHSDAMNIKGLKILGI